MPKEEPIELDSQDSTVDPLGEDQSFDETVETSSTSNAPILSRYLRRMEDMKQQLAQSNEFDKTDL